MIPGPLLPRSKPVPRFTLKPGFNSQSPDLAAQFLSSLSRCAQQMSAIALIDQGGTGWSGMRFLYSRSEAYLLNEEDQLFLGRGERLNGKFGVGVADGES